MNSPPEQSSEAFVAHAYPPAEQAWSRLLRSVDRWGRGRITLEVDVRAGNEVAARLTGSYVVLANGHRGGAEDPLA